MKVSIEPSWRSVKNMVSREDQTQAWKVWTMQLALGLPERPEQSFDELMRLVDEQIRHEESEGE